MLALTHSLSEIRTKVLLNFFQKIVQSRVKLWSLTAVSEKPLASGAFEEAWNPFAREKGSKNRLMVVVNLKNYPVDDF